MKKLSIILYSCAFLAAINTSLAQNINWASLKPDQRHIAAFQAGWDYSTSFGLGYGYQLNTKMPIVLNAQVSLPFGKNLDEVKSKVGAQVRVYKAGNFMFNVTVNSIYRRFKSDLVKLDNFGSEFAGVIGYYKPSWFVAGEFGFDKAIATHIKNSELMKDYYPGAQDGWYVPTGGNWQFGIQTGYSIKTIDFNLKIGRLINQSFQSSPMVPYYLQLSINKRF